MCPNPFYQIYEGAALLAGALPYFVNTSAARGFAIDYESVPASVWQRTQLLYTCSRRIRRAASCRWTSGNACSISRTGTGS